MDIERDSGEQSLFWPIIFAVFFGSFLATLSSTTVNIAFPVFVHEFQAEFHTVQWIMAGFLMATGIVAPVAGYLGDRFSYKRLYIGALAAFVFFSGLCAVAWNIESLIVFRVIQGACSGLMVPATLTIIYQVIEKEKQAFALSLWSVSSFLAPTFGPVIGGWLTEVFGWKSLFILNIPIGLLAIIVATRSIPYYKLGKKKSLDIPGLISVIVSSSAILVAVSQGPLWGWSSWRTVLLLAVGLVTLGFFIHRELTVSEPLLNLRVFRISSFSYSMVLLCIVSISIFSGTLLVPIYMQEVLYASAADTGLVMLPGCFILAVITVFVGKFYDRIGPFPFIISGVILVLYSTVVFGRMGMEGTALVVTCWLVVRYVGIGMVQMPVTNLGLSSVPKEYSGHASAITNWIRQGTSAIAIGVFTSILSLRSASHLQQLEPEAGPNAKVQALALGINDVYWIAVVVGVVSIPFILMLRRSIRKAKKAALAAREQLGG